MPTPATIHKDTFGYDTFRPLQCEGIGNILARDTAWGTTREVDL
jgi:hypothetical protein